MFVKLTSNNPDFSFVIQKNPSSGMLVRSIRLGRFFGWFVKPNEYAVFFKDSDHEVSYKRWANEEFEHCNTSRFNSAYIPLNVISDVFSTAYKKNQEKDTHGYENCFEISMIYALKPKYFEIMSQYCDGFDIKYSEVAKDCYNVKITTKKSIHELLNFVNLLCLLYAVTNNADYVHLSDELVAKYMQCLNVIDPPYMVRYVLKVNLFNRVEIFNKNKDLIEKTNKNNILYDLKFGSCSEMRRFEVYKYHKPTTKRLIDVGCGEGQYIKKYIDDVDFYYALDVDQDCINAVRKKISRNGWEEKLQVFDNIDALLENLDACVPHDVIMTEVLEHMEYQESIDFVDKVLKGVNVSKLTLTTPNKGFNRYYYQDANQLRHHDHKFELSMNELNVYLDEIINKNPDYQILHITSIGDCVRECENTESVSFLVQIAKKGQ